MKIDSYAVNTKATSYEEKIYAFSVTNRVATEADIAEVAKKTAPPEKETDEANLTESGMKALEEAQKKQQEENYKAALLANKIESPFGKIPMNLKELKSAVLDMLIYYMTGKKVRSQEVNLGQGGNSNGLSFGMFANGGGARVGTTQISSVEQMYYREQESMSYQAQGVVKTADGQTISIDINLNMSRSFEFYSEKVLGVRVQTPVDPLVINYGAAAASLTQTKFDFDLDADGVTDNVSFTGQGSGFLALDKNNDGKINDGNELFGTKSGDGFEDLRSYDSDKNGWIDENDDVYWQLKVWSKDENGNDQLYTLKDLDIGAIYLGDTATQFSLKGEGNVTDGQIRSTSFFLKDSGGAGTVQHVDLMV